MPDQPEKIIREDRRQWLEEVGRTTLLGGFGALSFYLWSRGAGERCVQPASPCAACQWWNACQLPKAVASKVEARR